MGHETVNAAKAAPCDRTRRGVLPCSRGNVRDQCPAKAAEEALPADIVAKIPANRLESPLPADALMQQLASFQQDHADVFTPGLLETLKAGEADCANAAQ